MVAGAGYAISVFALRAASLDELGQQAPLVRFGQLGLTTAGAIRTSGLELTAAGRNPHHFSVDFASSDGVDHPGRGQATDRSEVDPRSVPPEDLLELAWFQV
jgi:hypothetical protein